MLLQTLDDTDHIPYLPQLAQKSAHVAGSTPLEYRPDSPFKRRAACRGSGAMAAGGVLLSYEISLNLQQ